MRTAILLVACGPSEDRIDMNRNGTAKCLLRDGSHLYRVGRDMPVGDP